MQSHYIRAENYLNKEPIPVKWTQPKYPNEHSPVLEAHAADGWHEPVGTVFVNAEGKYQAFIEEYAADWDHDTLESAKAEVEKYSYLALSRHR